MKIRDVINYYEMIKSMIDNKTADINPLVKFKFLGMCKQFEPIINNYDTVRDDIILKYGKSSDDGGFGIFAPVKEKYNSDEEYNKAVEEYNITVENFKNEINKILDAEADITFNKLKYTDVVDTGIPADYLLAIYDLIEE